MLMVWNATILCSHYPILPGLNRPGFSWTRPALFLPDTTPHDGTTISTWATSVLAWHVIWEKQKTAGVTWVLQNANFSAWFTDLANLNPFWWPHHYTIFTHFPRVISVLRKLDVFQKSDKIILSWDKKVFKTPWKNKVSPESGPLSWNQCA